MPGESAGRPLERAAELTLNSQRMVDLDSVGGLLPEVARRAIDAWVKLGLEIEADHPGAPAAPVFVTLRGPNGTLRGCIGSLSPTKPDVSAETARSAVLAATRDPRFVPVRAEELAHLKIEVSVLLPPEPISGLSQLDPRRYGVVVRDECGRQGLLLPEVPGIDDAATQVIIARRKAGVDPEAPVTLRRFEVKKFV
jgi:AmmeMemoRadiSam system protein A